MLQRIKTSLQLRTTNNRYIKIFNLLKQMMNNDLIQNTGLARSTVAS